MPKQSNRNILVIRLSAMGDVAMVVPVLRALTTQHPSLQITVLTKALFEPFFRDIANVNVIVANIKGEHKGVYGLYKLARSINSKYRFYATADLHCVLRSKILKKFIKCKRFISIDKGRKEKKLLTSGKIFQQLKTTHQRYADVFESLGYPVDLSKPNFPEPIHLNNALRQIIGETRKGLVGIAPFAAHDGKMYPLNLMEEVVKILDKSYKVLLFGGGKNEVAILNRWQKFNNNTISVAGKLSMDEEMDLISNLNVMLSMDSGNGHLAAMLGVKVVTLWGVTHPYAGFTPFNQPDHYALTADRDAFPLIPTSVYGNKYPDGYNKAMSTILPKEVVSKIENVLIE